MELLAAAVLAIAPADFRAEVAALAGDREVVVEGRAVRIGARPTGSRTLALARRYLAGAHRRAGLAAREQPYPGGVNLVVSRGEARETVVVGAHLDTVPGTPGADDNASGSAAVLLIGRALRQWTCARSIELVHFDGEETGMKGSQAYVADLARRRTVVAALNFDVIGYDSDGDGRMLVHAGDDPRSHALVPLLLGAARVAAPRLRPRVLKRDSYRTSDVVRFWEARWPALYLTENFFGDWNRAFHTPRDGMRMLNETFGAAIASAAARAVASWARCTPPAP